MVSVFMLIRCRVLWMLFRSWLFFVWSVFFLFMFSFNFGVGFIVVSFLLWLCWVFWEVGCVFGWIWFWWVVCIFFCVWGFVWLIGLVWRCVLGLFCLYCCVGLWLVYLIGIGGSFVWLGVWDVGCVFWFVCVCLWRMSCCFGFLVGRIGLLYNWDRSFGFFLMRGRSVWCVLVWCWICWFVCKCWVIGFWILMDCCLGRVVWIFLFCVWLYWDF